MKPYLSSCLPSGIVLLGLLAACRPAAEAPAGAAPFEAVPVATFDEPWALAFLPDGRMLVTEKRGRLQVVSADGARRVAVAGVPAVDYGGQGGLGDVAIGPEGHVYLSWAEAGPGDTRGAAVGRGRLVESGNAARLEDFQLIWRQEPKVSGRGHYGHRILFTPDGRHMYLTSGDRQKLDPAQDANQTLGKILRLTPDGAVPAGNPFSGEGGARAQIWSLGHRNPLGIAFDGSGRLWEVEMGPAGGDELNLVQEARNYGWPVVSEGDHYGGQSIPGHASRSDYEAPRMSWNPVISPSSLIIYSGDLFPAWRGSALIGGLSSRALVRVAFDGETAREVERFPMGARIREVEQGPDGAIWLLEDGRTGRLLRLSPSGK